jgi:predicted nucleic-acid-binding Zn-ribbon protein
MNTMRNHQPMLSLAPCSSTSNDTTNYSKLVGSQPRGDNRTENHPISLPLPPELPNTDSNQVVAPSLASQRQLVPIQSRSMFKCPKCGCRSYTLGQSLCAGGFLSKILNIQTRKFVTVTCNDCGFSEFYERYQSPWANVIDIFIR